MERRPMRSQIHEEPDQTAIINDVNYQFHCTEYI
jgi:hypothetical protein